MKPGDLINVLPRENFGEMWVFYWRLLGLTVGGLAIRGVRFWFKVELVIFTCLAREIRYEPR